MGITVVIADDHAIVRQGIASLLKTNRDIEVVGEARDGKDAVKVVQRLRPNVALLDVSMPNMNGLTAALRIPKASPRTRVVILSMYADRDLIMQALQAGARGYLTKQSLGSDVGQAIYAVARGEVFLSPDVAATVVHDYLALLHTRPDAPLELTVREREVLQLIAEGRTNKEIAEQLDTSVKTVDTHRTHIMKRLKIHDLAGLVKYAVRHRLIQP
jgi:DNA-binding NarL/FixJ family response regulator